MGEETVSEVTTEQDDLEKVVTELDLAEDESAEDASELEDAPAVSEDTPAVSEDTLAVSEDTPAVSEDTLAVSEDTLAVSEDEGVVGEDVLAVSEDEGVVGEDVLAVSEDTLAVSEDEGADEDSRKWYVVHCYSGYENKVKRNLEQRISSMDMEGYIFQVVVPTEEEIEVREGKRRTYQRRVFPGYILVQMIMTDSSWYVVRNTPGVTGFVGMGSKPTPLREEEVNRIIKRMEAEAPKVKVTFKPGQKVRIIQGPFADFIGTVDDINMEKGKVRVMVSFFGRETPVELDFLQVEKV